MRGVAQENDLEYNKDVKMVSTGTISTFYDYLQNHKNMTDFGVVFCTDQ